jgi:hypothetical protein
MRYAVGKCSGAMIYIPSIINTGSPIHKLIGWDTQIHRKHGNYLNLLTRLKMALILHEKLKFLSYNSYWLQYKYQNKSQNPEWLQVKK